MDHRYVRGRVEDRGSIRWIATLEDLWGVYADSSEAQISKKETEPLISERNEDRGSCSMVSEDCDSKEVVAT
jgi:hypothetical protein